MVVEDHHDHRWIVAGAVAVVAVDHSCRTRTVMDPAVAVAAIGADMAEIHATMEDGNEEVEEDTIVVVDTTVDGAVGMTVIVVEVEGTVVVSSSFRFSPCHS